MVKNIHYDLILKNGTVVLPDKTVKTDIGIKGESIPVSYTHLTLPTILLV